MNVLFKYKYVILTTVIFGLIAYYRLLIPFGIKMAYDVFWLFSFFLLIVVLMVILNFRGLLLLKDRFVQSLMILVFLYVSYQMSVSFMSIFHLIWDFLGHVDYSELFESVNEQTIPDLSFAFFVNIIYWITITLSPRKIVEVDGGNDEETD